MKYAIISLKWTHKDDDFITFWRHESKGYAWYKIWIGKYSYTKAVVNEADKIIPYPKLKPLWTKIFIEGHERKVILNTLENRKALGITKKDLKQLRPSFKSNYKILKTALSNNLIEKTHG